MPKNTTVAVKEESAPAVFKIADLARAHGIDPKRARARLRKKMNKLTVNGMPAWTFPLDKEEEMLAIIRGTSKEDASEEEDTAAAE